MQVQYCGVKTYLISTNEELCIAMHIY